MSDDDQRQNESDDDSGCDCVCEHEVIVNAYLHCKRSILYIEGFGSAMKNPVFCRIRGTGIVFASLESLADDGTFSDQKIGAGLVKLIRFTSVLQEKIPPFVIGQVNSFLAQEDDTQKLDLMVRNKTVDPELLNEFTSLVGSLRESDGSLEIQRIQVAAE
jgi:hypothetical protein